MTDGTQQSKHWCFTINNYTEYECEQLKQVPGVTYLVFGKEIGDEGTPHLQGYIELDKRKRLMQMKNINGRAHWERRQSSPINAANYCKKGSQSHDEWLELRELGPNWGKDADFYEFGQIFRGGRSGGNAMRTRYQTAYELAYRGELASIDADIQIRHYSSLRAIAMDNISRPDDLEDTCGVWIVGPPGVGKSTRARVMCEGIFYDKSCNKWWDGYRNEDNVIVDDLDKNHKVLGHHIKRWCDKFSFPAEKKGTTISIRPKRVIITSNYTPEEIFEDNSLAAAIVRRCEIIKILIKNF